MKTMKQQRVEIEEVIDTINDNINHMRSDLEICLPELTGSLHGLMEEYFLDIEFLGDKLALGQDNPLIRFLEQEGNKLIDSVNQATYLANIMLRNTECDWESYTDEAPQSVDHIVATGSTHQSAEHFPAEQFVATVATHQSAEHLVATDATHQSAEQFVATGATHQSAECFVATDATHQSAEQFPAEQFVDTVAAHQPVKHFVDTEATHQSAEHFVPRMPL